MQELNLETQPEPVERPIIRRSLIVWIVGLVASAALIILAFLFFQNTFGPNGSLQVVTARDGAKVFVNDSLVGETNYRGDFRPGEYLVKVEDATRSATAWQSKVQVNPGTLTSVERDLGPTEEFSSGVILSLSRGSGIGIISTPSGAQVFLDGTDIGQTPLSRPAPSPGTHSLKIVQEGYIDKEVQINTTNGWKLEVSASLYKNPDPGVSLIEEVTIRSTSSPDIEIIKREVLGLDKIASGSATGEAPWTKAQFFNLGTEDNVLLSNTSDWLKGLYYYALVHLVLPDLPFNYLIDSKGFIYEGRGGSQTISVDPMNSLADASKNPTLRPGVAMVGYLGPTEVSKEAKDSFQKLVTWIGKSTKGVQQVRILETGVGFLRVRSEPSTGSSEIARVTPGEAYELLAEQTGWFKIKLSDGREGWISSQYATKI